MAKKVQSTLINMLAVLTCVSAVAALALALVSNVTAEPIAQAERAKTEAAIQAVLPEYDRLQETVIAGQTCTEALDAAGSRIGLAVEAKSSKAFGGDLVAMVGFDADGRVSGYKILKSAETPGLGAKADEWFQKGGKGDVIGTDPATPIAVKKDGGTVDAISGSTITSRAFCEIINNAYQIYQKGGNE